MTLQQLLDFIDEFKFYINKQGLLTKKDIDFFDRENKVRATYFSNSIEGNSLSLHETDFIIKEKISIHNKPLNDIYDVSGHSDAYDFVIQNARSLNFNVTEDFIKKINFLFYHRINYERAGVYRNQNVRISGREDVILANPSDIESLMKTLIEDYDKYKDNIHQVVLSAYMHLKFVAIHPFIDGNGRTARLLTNSILINQGYQFIDIRPEIKIEYSDAIYESVIMKDITDISKAPFFTFIAKCQLIAQKELCHRLNIDVLKDKNYDTYKLFDEKKDNKRLKLK
jgi:Fic family protein